MPELPTLYHYTCDHGRDGIDACGYVKPGCYLSDQPSKMPWPSRFAWFTDLSVPIKGALGLTSNFTTCDRTAHRYRVLAADDIEQWTDRRRALAPEQRDWLELAPGARPRHWYVTTSRVAVEYDPLEVRNA